MEILFGSTNEGKVREVQEYLKGSDAIVVSISRFLERGVCHTPPPEVDEDQSTYEGNVRKKVELYAQWSKIPCMADDTGLEVEVLNGAPGIISARYAGEPSDPKRNIEKLLLALEGKQNRNARFVCVVALQIPGQLCKFFHGELKGHIATNPEGGGGFGYDSVFIPSGYSETLATLKEHRATIITHRQAAMKLLLFALVKST